MKNHLFAFLFMISAYSFSYSQNLENKHYGIEISIPDSMNYVKITAKLDIINLNTLTSDTLKIDLCNGFTGVFFDSLSIFADDIKLGYTVKDDFEINIVLPNQIKSKKTSIFTFNYGLFKVKDYEKIPYSDFAFQANQFDVHVNSAATRTDNWIPKLIDSHTKRLPPFSIKIAIPKGYEVMASGKLKSYKEENNYKIFVYNNYNGLTDRGLYFFVSPNIKIEKEFPDGFKLTMYVPQFNIKENVEYIANFVYKAYRYYESVYGKTNFNEYKINSFSSGNTYSGLLNSCNVPQWIFTKPIKNNELFAPTRDLFHEISHTWWGNIVVPDANFDYWLFEGFAKFSEPVFLKNAIDYNMEKTYQKRLKITVAGNIDFIPPLKFVSSEIKNQSFKNDAAYFQGGLFLLTLKQLVGENNFWKGMQEYVSVNYAKTVNSDDFIKAMQNNTKVNIKDYYYDYLNKSGFAEYSTKIISSKKKGSEYTHIIEIKNTGSKELFTNICKNTDLQHDTINIYIPKGKKEIIEVKSTKPDTTNIVIIDPDNMYLVRRQGIRSPGTQFYTDKNGNIGVALIIPDSPFGKAGIKEFSTIVSIDGEDISKKDIFQQALLIQRIKGTKLKVIAKASDNKEIEYIVEY